MNECLPPSPSTFEFESDISDCEYTDDHSTLTMFESAGATEHDSSLNSATIQMWDMTDELSDGFPTTTAATNGCHSMVTSYSTTTDQCDFEEDYYYNSKLQSTLFSEEEYSQELMRGSTTTTRTESYHQQHLNQPQPAPIMPQSRKKLLINNQDSSLLYKPATSKDDSSTTMSIKNNIYQTICPHLLSVPPQPMLADRSILNTSVSTLPMDHEEETDVSTDEEGEQHDDYSYISTTTIEDDADSDLDYSDSGKSKKKRKKTSTTTKSTNKRKTKATTTKDKIPPPTQCSTSTTTTTTTSEKKKKKSKKDHKSDVVMVAEGNINRVYTNGFLKVSIDMPAQCSGLSGSVPACKPVLFYGGSNLIRDTSDSSKFKVRVKAVNCPNDFEMDSIELVVLSCSSKERGGEVMNIERIVDREGEYDSTVSSHCVLKKDPSGNDLLLINDSSEVVQATTEINLDCSITTSNNHGDWPVKHNYYRLLAFTGDDRVIGGLSIPFKVAKNASGVSPKKVSSEQQGQQKAKKHAPTLEVVVSGRKRVHKLTTKHPETIIKHGGKKYKVTLTALEDN